jgi:hypothetical protein
MDNYRVEQSKEVSLLSIYKKFSEYSSSGQLVIDNNNQIIFANDPS